MKKIFLSCIAMALMFLASCKNETTPAASAQDVPKANEPALIAMVMKDGKYGYIDTEGNYLIEPLYPMARLFSNGLACVNIEGVRTDLFQGAVGGKYIFINTAGEVQFDGKGYLQPTSFLEGFAPVRLSDQEVGFINTNGDLVKQGFNAIMPFHEGLATALDLDQGIIGYVDTQGNWKIQKDENYTLGDFYQGRAFFKKDNQYGFLDTTGAEVIPASYEATYDFHEGLAAYLQEDLFGFMDLNGTEVIPNIYEDVADFSEGLCAVQKDGKWGFINKENEFVIENQYTAVRNFSQGFAAVQVDGKVGYIDLKGNWLVEPKYGNAMDFKNGFAIVQRDNGLGYINLKGEEVIPPIFQRADNFVDPQASNPILQVN
ncbi:WG repeat-containing protein [Gilvibacter sediminis]|uniref:WG repeat-containing protein n=1 Tax=Gilvibacter sediminis TaxID=379071 RepID=UPI0023504853|nr:WG repeat-containing protein [Gilvibacter sediminis]MDC7996540.1 WG repeat-containing protein [Gilvibacter sediminis]